MKLRKANAVCSLISTMLLFSHAISLAAWMLSKGRIHRLPSIMALALTVFFIIHAILSIVIMISSHRGNKERKGKGYPRLNAPTVAQRISGALLIVFTALHILGACRITHTPQVVHAIVHPLFFFLVLAHVAISTSKAFITLGIGNARFIKYADIGIKVVCAATLIADVTGFYLFVC